jgi:hypothetical protein
MPNYIQPGAGFGSYRPESATANCPVHTTLAGRRVGSSIFSFRADCGDHFTATGTLIVSTPGKEVVVSAEPGASFFFELDTGKAHKP